MSGEESVDVLLHECAGECSWYLVLTISSVYFTDDPIGGVASHPNATAIL